MKFRRRIRNAFYSPGLIYTVIRNIKEQKQFIRETINPQLEAARKEADGTMDDRDFKKITCYYGLAVPAVLGEAFCALRGRPMTHLERTASTYQGVITGLGDDFFDKREVNNEALRSMIDQPQQFEGGDAFEKLSLQFLKTALSSVPDPKRMQEQLGKVYLAQVRSRSQSAPGLSYEEMLDITIQKGAESLLFYRTVFSNPMNIREEKALYCLGGLMQLSNDIFDVYEDQQQGINTLLTTAKNMGPIRTLFLSLMQMGYEAAYRTRYPRRNVKRFIDIISIAIFSRCLVCLDQLESKEKLSNNVFTPDRYKRKDLVCDMDTPVNKWRSVKYHIKYAE